MQREKRSSATPGKYPYTILLFLATSHYTGPGSGQGPGDSGFLWGPLDASNLKDDLSKDVRFYTRFLKFIRFIKT